MRRFCLMLPQGVAMKFTFEVHRMVKKLTELLLLFNYLLRLIN